MSTIFDFFDKRVLTMLPASSIVWTVERFEPITIKENFTKSKQKIIKLNSFNSNSAITTDFYKPIDRLFSNTISKHD